MKISLLQKRSIFSLLKEPPLIFKEALISFIEWKKLRNIFYALKKSIFNLSLILS